MGLVRHLVRVIRPCYRLSPSERMHGSLRGVILRNRAGLIRAQHTLRRPLSIFHEDYAHKLFRKWKKNDTSLLHYYTANTHCHDSLDSHWP